MQVPTEPGLVTVAIPCYNQGRFLAEAVESVRRQTYARWEIVVVDDGATDDTAAVAGRFADVRLVRQPNQGLSAARNAALAAARGEYVVFLDADDRLLPDALALGLRTLAAHPQAAFAYGRVRLIAGDGTPLHRGAKGMRVERDHYATLLRNNFIWSPGVVIYRRRVLREVGGFDRRVDGSADYELNARIARRFPVCCSGEAVLEYRVHGQNMSGDPEVMLRSSVGARRVHRKELPDDPLLRQAWRAGVRRVQADYGERVVQQVRGDLRAGAWRRAARGLLALVRFHPRGAVRIVTPGALARLYRRWTPRRSAATTD